MIFSYNWLKEYTGVTLPAKDLASVLTMAGIEVESAEPAPTGVEGVVTASILSVEKHPNADKLSVCKVRTPDKEHLIVCGASNMKAGDRVALALPGAKLPGGVEIGRAKIRGIESGGMMCSESELGLKKKSEGIMILPGDVAEGLDFNGLFASGDFILSVSITPNRPDCMSVVGLAREISALTGAAFDEKAPAMAESLEKASSRVSVAIEDASLCKRYLARVIEGVKIGVSPAWMRARLELMGIRSINNVVDATNYVMVETGQPLHAFDLDKISGMKIIARRAKENESIVTIDGKKRELTPNMLVIADASAPQAVAGVMGGKASEVTASTKRILLESASFDALSVRRTSRALGLSSDSSARFERGVDTEGAAKALDRAAALIKELSKGEILSERLDEYPEKARPAGVTFRYAKAAERLGFPVDAKEAEKIFKSLGMDVREEGGALLVTPPSFRSDIKIEADLVEEAARVMGYGRIPSVMPKGGVSPQGAPGAAALKRRIRSALTSAGFFEAVNYSFVSPVEEDAYGEARCKRLRITNPLSEEQSVMRTGLLPSLLRNLSLNLSRKNESVRLFECRPVFIPGLEKLPDERITVSGVIYGERWGVTWNRERGEADFYDAKGAVEHLFSEVASGADISFEAASSNAAGSLFHPGKSAAVKVNGKDAGFVGELHPDVLERFDIKGKAYGFELDAGLIGGAALNGKYEPLPKFPESSRDAAFIIDETVPYADVLSVARAAGSKLIENIEVFDVYYGKNVPHGKRSLAIRITYRALDRTLTQPEVEDAHAKVVKELSSRFNIEARA